MTTTPNPVPPLDRASLTSPYVRYMLGREMPEIPEDLLAADTYLLSIITAVLLDGRQEVADGDREPA